MSSYQTSVSNQVASFNPYYQYNQNNVHSGSSLYPTTTSAVSNKENKRKVTTTQKAPNTTTEKLCYTIEQLDLLNAIYNEIRYPNSVQKTMIANIIGINREQTKAYLIIFNN